MRAVAAAALLAVLGGAPVRAAESVRTFVVDPARSSVQIHVGKAGLFKFAGHEHLVLAPRLTGEVLVDSDDPGRSSVALTFDAGALTVSAEGEPSEDVPKVQAKMLSAELLDAARFPTISFRSKAVAGKAGGGAVRDVTVTGDLTVRSVTRSLVLPIRVELQGETLTATGHFEIKHTDYDLTPVSVAGVVKVKNEIRIDCRIVAGPAKPTADDAR